MVEQIRIIMKQSKVCNRCKEDKPLTKEYYYCKSATKDGFEGICKKCNRTRKSNIYKKEEAESKGNRICGICKNEYPMTQEYFFRRKANKKGFQTVCKNCKYNTPALIKRRKIGNDSLVKVLKERYRALLHRSKIKNLIVDIDVDDLINIWDLQNGQCAISGIKMRHEIYSGKIDSNVSVDRIDSNFGYTKNNIQLVCSSINKMKSTLTMEQFIELCNLIIKFNKS
jgi:hypothetical protein